MRVLPWQALPVGQRVRVLGNVAPERGRDVSRFATARSDKTALDLTPGEAGSGQGRDHATVQAVTGRAAA